MKNQNQPIAKEGYPFICLLGFVTLVFAVLGWGCLTLILLALTLFTAYFFRNPERRVPSDEKAMISPADGKIVFAGVVNEERFLKAEVNKVSIFMSMFNVHVNRVPLAGKVIDLYYNKGKFLNATLDKSSELNEQSGIILETKEGKQILVVQIAGLIARRIVSYPEIGDELQKGLRYGIIRFGSRLDVYFPKEWKIDVAIGDKVTGGETVIGLVV
jgi:phosphatidylserine decarboxylase